MITDWKDVTYKQFLKLKEIAEDNSMTEDIKLLEMVLTLYGDKPITELWKYTQSVNNLISQPLPTGDTIANTLEVNGHKYKVTKDLAQITTAQYIDYTNYAKNGAELINLLSCFIIPEGHKYDDGYDMEEAKKDIADLSVVTVENYCFFFRKKWLTSLKTSLVSLMADTLALKGMTWKNKLRMVWAQATLLRNMDYLTSYSQSYKNLD